MGGESVKTIFYCFSTLTVAAVAILLSGCGSTATRAPAGSEYGPVIRVLLGEESEPFVVECRGGFRIETESGLVLTRSSEPSKVNIKVDGESVQMRFDPQETAAVAEGDIFITPVQTNDLAYQGITYAGRIKVDTEPGGVIRVVNVLPLEAYLEGVVPHEIGDPGPDAFAAMEAQAITARTYAMTRMAKRANERFDVYASVQDQVYRGRERTSRLATGAVRETRGVVLEYKKELAFTYYCATCGGHTSDIRRVWPDREPAKYLYGALDRGDDESGSFCAWVHNFRWRFDFSAKELGRILRITIPRELGVSPDKVGRLVDIGVSERSPSGRVKFLEIITTEGVFTIEGDRIRWVLQTDLNSGRILPSTLFNLEKETSGPNLVSVGIVGGGNGHGVGMCQNGAIGMARRGYSRDMILQLYYPGTSLTTRY
jgi:stage II sporulation protein D